LEDDNMLSAKDAIEHHAECMSNEEAELWAAAMDAASRMDSVDPEDRDLAREQFVVALKQIAQIMGVHL